MKKRFSCFIIYCFVSILLSAMSVSAKTVYVDGITGDDSDNGSSWPLAKKTVQGGINAAAENDSVWVAAGTYIENVHMKSGVALYGGFSGDESALEERDFTENNTILDGNDNGSVITVPSGASSTTRIDGFSITNGSGTDIEGETYGGGIYCGFGSAVVIVNNRIYENTADTGAGVYTHGNSLNIISADPAELTAIAGTKETITFSIPEPAPAGGLTLALSSSNTAAATVGGSAVIPEGESSVDVEITAKAYGKTTIAAQASGYETARVPVMVINDPLITFDPSPVNVIAGLTQACSLHIANPAPAGGLTVTLTGTAGKISIPATIKVPSYSQAVVFTITGVAQGDATITAAAEGYPDAVLIVTVAKPQFKLFPPILPVARGRSSSLTLSIPGGYAPAGGLEVDISSSSPTLVTVSAKVTIPEGSQTVSVPLNAIAVGSSTITAFRTGFQNGTATVNVFALYNISFNPTSLKMQQGLSLNVDLYVSSPAPEGGIIITLANPSPEKVSLPSTVFMPASQNMQTIQVTNLSLADGESVTVTASSPGLTDGTLTITGTATLDAELYADVTVGAGTRSQGNVQLTTGTAPAGGYTVNLASADPAIATVPASVTIPSGNSYVNFPIVGKSAGSTTITMTVGGPAETDTVTVVQPGFTWYSVPASLTLGNTDAVQVRTNVAGGNYYYYNYTTKSSSTTQNVDAALTINLTSLHPEFIEIPATATIPAGRYYTDNFNISAVGIGTSTLTAEATGWTSATSSTIEVIGLDVDLYADVTVGAGTRSQGNVQLKTGTAPAGGYTVNLASADTGIATVPASVTIPSGSSYVNFTIVGKSVGSTTITMTDGEAIETDTVTVVQPGFTWYSVPATLTFGNTDAVQVRTNVPGGNYYYYYYTTKSSDVTQNVDTAVTVALSSSNATVVEIPATVTIGAGTYYASITISADGIGTSTLTAEATGWTSATSSTIEVIGLDVDLYADVTVGAGTRSSGNVQLKTGTAPAGGYTVNLASADTGIATVPASVTIPSGSSYVNFTITGKSAGSTTITMTDGEATETDTVTVVQPGFSWSSVPASLLDGNTDTVQVRTNVPGGNYYYYNYTTKSSDVTQNVDTAVTVDLSSSNAAVVEIPATATIAAGNYYVNSTITAAGPGAGTLTAEATGWTSATSSAIEVTELIYDVDLYADVTVGAGTRSQGNVQLKTGTAPAGGYTVNLASADTGIATVPASVTIPSGSSYVNFTITGKSVGSTTITMTDGEATETDTVTVVQPGFTWSSVPTSMIVGNTDSVQVRTNVPGGNYYYYNYTTKSSDATQNVDTAVTVSLSSQNAAVVEIPATATIGAGTYYANSTATAVGTGTTYLTVEATGWTSADSTSILVNLAGASLTSELNSSVAHVSPEPAGVDASAVLPEKSLPDLKAPETTVLMADRGGYMGGTASTLFALAMINAFDMQPGAQAGILLTVAGYGSDAHSPTIENNMIYNNTAKKGGGIVCSDSSPIIRNNLIIGNTATGYTGGGGGGGGIYVGGADSKAYINGDTICGNSATAVEGGGVYLQDGLASIRNCVLRDNGDDLRNAEAAYSCVTSLALDPGTGNTEAAPGFVQTTAPGDEGYYRLGYGSALIDAGDPAYTADTNEKDIDGTARIFHGRVDMGADEFLPAGCNTLGDTDGDGICNDGDGSGVAGDHPCTGGNTVFCDDNCPDLRNSDQTDDDGDGVGDDCRQTAITLASFEAKPGNSTVTLVWRTGDETDNFGFNVYRADAQAGEYIKINASVIASKAVAGAGATYEFADNKVQNRKTYWYKLEDVDVNGKATMHGPVSATPRLIYILSGE